MQTCALKHGDGRYQANERGEERKTCHSLQTAQETRGSSSAPVSSTLESGSGRGQAGGQSMVALQTVPTLLVWLRQGRGSGPREGVFLEKCVLGHPSALAY